MRASAVLLAAAAAASLAPAALAGPHARPAAAPAAAAPAAAAPGAPTLADVQSAIADNKISLAHRLAEQVIAAHPDDAQTAYLAASACMAMGLFDDANRHLDAALVVHPKTADLHGLRASIAALRGDDDTARREAAVALGLDATQADAVDVKAQLDIVDRYQHHTSPAPAAGSPSAAVVAFLAKVAARAPGAELADDLDPGILAKAPAGLPATRDSLVAVIDGAYEAADAQMSAGSIAFTAYEVGVDAPGDVVPVKVVIDNQWTAARVAQMKALFDDPQGKTMLDPETTQIFDGLDPADREATLGRLVGSHRRTVADLNVPVVRVGGAMKIADLELSGTSLRDQLLPMLPHLMDTVGGPGAGAPLYDPHLPDVDYPHRSRIPTSAYIGLIGAAVGLVSLLLRRR